jgi:hypothetical protein
MMTFGEYAAFLRKSADLVDMEIETTAAVIAEAAAAEAKYIIGHKQPDWDSLADPTKEQKGRMGFSGPEFSPLLRTGEMRDSIKWIATSMGGVIGSNDKVLYWHEVGTPKMPPRPVLGRALLSTIPLLEQMLGETAVRLLSPITR